MNGNYHGKIERLNLSDWIVTKFYHYTSFVNDPDFYEYDEVWYDKKLGDPYIKELYQHFLKIAEFYSNNRLYDNKTTIEIKNINTGETKYITSKDGRYLYGNSVWSEWGYVTTFGMTNYNVKEQ